MEVQKAFSQIKRGGKMHFFYCEQGEDGKPVLLVDIKAIPSKETNAVLAKAKKKKTCKGRMEMNDAGELNILPKGSAPSSLAKNVQIVARNNHAMVFKGIVVGAEEPEEAEESTDETPEPTDKSKVPPPPPPPTTDKGKTDGEIPPAPPPPDQSKVFQARLKNVLPAYQKAVQGGSPQAAELKTLYDQVKSAMDGKDFTKGLALLEKLETAVKQAESTGGGTDETAFRQKWEAAKTAYQSANDTIDAQISKLQSALNNSGDPELETIAELGLNALTGNNRVPTMVGIRGVDGASGPQLPGAAAKALAAVERFRKHLDTEEAIAACDSNPFGVSVTIQKTLGDALDQLAQVLKTVK